MNEVKPEKDPAKRESLFHYILIHTNEISPFKKGERRLRQLINEHGTIEQAARHIYGSSLEGIVSRRKELQKIVKKLSALPFKFATVTINSPHYPACLRELQDAPPVLYLRGNPELLKLESIAVVGTRKLYDEADIRNGEKMVKEFLRQGKVIVSGLALGCDTLAHRCAIENNGKTIAVLGTPLDKCYPSQNKDLQELIAREHLLVSQYPIGIKTYRSHFAHRNATTVGLSSEGVAVIAAGDSSGTQYAIKECIEQKKQLYVLESNLEKGYKWVEKYKGKYKIIGKEA